MLKIKWIECIKIQSIVPAIIIAELQAIIRDLAITPGLVHAELYIHSTRHTHLAFTLAWNSKPPSGGSQIGLALKQRLAFHGLAEHGAWIRIDDRTGGHNV